MRGQPVRALPGRGMPIGRLAPRRRMSLVVSPGGISACPAPQHGRVCQPVDQPPMQPPDCLKHVVSLRRTGSRMHKKIYLHLAADKIYLIFRCYMPGATARL